MCNKRYCTVCGKEKEQRRVGFGDISVFIECECERKLREEKERIDAEFAEGVALKLRNKSSNLSLMGCTASFKNAVVDKYNERGISGGKYLLSQLLEDEQTRGKNSLVLQGNRGSGKTYVACAVINGYNARVPLSDLRKRQILKERDYGYGFNEFTSISSPCKFITEMDLFALFYDDFNFRRVDSPVNQFKCAEKLLVIDDVGSSNFENHRIQAMYLNIIDYRQSERLPIMLTTNLTKSEMSAYLGDRAFDRLESCCYFVDMTSPESRRR